MEYSNISLSFATDFIRLTSESKSIVITSHVGYDDDSIASVLAIFDLVANKYPEKKVRILYSGQNDQKFISFKNFHKIEFIEDIADSIEDADLLIMLDGGKFSRFSKKPEKLKSISKTICIDHHLSPTDNFSLSLIAPQYSSCSELVYLSLFSDQKIDGLLAEVFLLGILGDTGNFTYLKPQQTDTLLTTKKLLDISQIEIQEFQSRYTCISKRVLSLIQLFIKNTTYQSINGWPDFQYSFLERDTILKNNFTHEEVTEASHLYSTSYIRKTIGYTWGFVVTPNNDDVNVSCRSLPNSVNVRKLMENMGIGGGHNRASGGNFTKKDEPLSVSSCVEKVLDWIKSNPCELG